MSGSSSSPSTWLNWAWHKWGWGAEQEARAERTEARQAGDAQQTIAERIHEQKVRRRDVEMRLDRAATRGKEIKAAGGKDWEKRAMVHAKAALVLRKQMAQIDGVIDNLEAQQDALVNVSSTVSVVSAMSEGATQMKTMLKQTNVDDIETTMDSVTESFDAAAEVMDAISRPLAGGPTVVDEEALQGVFDEWEEEEATQAMARVGLNGRAAQAPVAPTETAAETETNSSSNNRGGGGGNMKIPVNEQQNT